MVNKKTKGKQKIEMKKIENDEDKLVTFSKRRTGINKKASELVTLCGAEVGVLVFSPSGRPFSYGHPSFESVATRFLEQNRSPERDNIARPLVDAHRKQRIDNLNNLYNDLNAELEVELEREQMLEQVLSRQQTEDWWWRKPVEELNKEEAMRAFAYYKELHEKLCCKIKERNAITAASMAIPSRNFNAPLTFPFHGGPSQAGPSSLSFPPNKRL